MTSPLQNSGFKKTATVAHVVAKTLQKHGVRQFFGQSLPSMFVLAAEELGIRQIAYRTENAGGYMADAFARISHTPGIVTAQNGPAAALLVAPLAEAMKVSIPVIALVQDVPRNQHDKNAFQDLDHIGMFQSVTKWVRRVTDASRVEDYIDQAFVAACSGRPGPVVLLLPADLLLEQQSAPHDRHSVLGTFPLDRPCANAAEISKALDLLGKAKRPVIVAGGGVHVSGASTEVVELSKKLGIPVATTNMGKGVIADSEPLALGVMANCMGPNGSGRYLKEFLTDADVVFLIGNRTNQNGTDSWSLYPSNAQMIHLDIDPMEIGRNYEADVRLVGDAKETLSLMLKALSGKPNKDHSAIAVKIAQGRKMHEEEVFSICHSDETPMRPERLMTVLNQHFTAKDIAVADASYSTLWITNYLRVQANGQRFLTPRGLAGLGWGMPMAMGARVASKEGVVFCLVGDGGFAHVWSEMETCARMGIKVITILINNGILGYQKHAENLKFGQHTSAVHFADVDHSAIARACNINGVRVQNAKEFESALVDAISSDQSTLIEAMCTSNAFPPITFYTPEAQ